MITYIFVIAILNKKIFPSFFADFKSHIKELIFISFCITIFLLLLYIFVINKNPDIITTHELIIFGLVLVIMSFGMFTLWRFGKVVEETGFKKRIKISELREGDVLDDSKLWEGLTKEQIKKLQKSNKKYVVIKEGVRFAPTFPIALMFTIFFGDAVFLVVGLI